MTLSTLGRRCREQPGHFPRQPAPGKLSCLFCYAADATVDFSSIPSDSERSHNLRYYSVDVTCPDLPLSNIACNARPRFCKSRIGKNIVRPSIPNSGTSATKVNVPTGCCAGTQAQGVRDQVHAEVKRVSPRALKIAVAFPASS
jgi:hypothetical protein